MAVRLLLATALATAMMAGGVDNLALVSIMVIGALTFGGRHLLSLKNFFLGYSIMVFVVGAGVLHLAPTSVFDDLVAYLIAFLLAYSLGSRMVKAGGTFHRSPDGAAGRGEPRLAVIEAAMVALVLLNLIFLMVQLLRYGIGGYYRGAALLDQFLTYGEASAGGGAEQIVRFVLKFSGVGLIVLYTQACFARSSTIRYRYPIAILVLLPILTLRRYDAVIGAITVLAIYGCERRTKAPGRSAHGNEETLRRQRPRQLGFTRSAALAGALASAAAAALAIGLLRQGFQVGATGTAPAATGTLPVLTSELTPVQAYSEITENIGILGHPHGRTIVPPLVLKLVPRAWYPDKPLNSGGYYMTVLRPAEYAAGYALPPTFFGDAYLNFGFFGALGACALLGLIAARLDAAYKDPIIARMPLFLLLWANFFSIMREPMSESLAGVLLSVAVWRVTRHVLQTKVAPPIGNRSSDPGRVPGADNAVVAGAYR